MFHIIYMSSAVVPFSPAELQALLETSRRNNTTLGVTGLLLYKDGNFLQVIEGEQAVVDELYSKISRDRRHRGCVPLFKESISQREFANWSMAFRDLDSSPEQFPDGFNELLNTNWSQMDLSSYSSKVRAFMKMFAN
ncbi:MAG: BLUF domain-containing protein [Opitutaceae bacterium]|nr:BLUF domain-containing protein [Verrucomicrobiales bacterium]